MRKLLFIFLAVFIVSNSAMASVPKPNQGNWRWRNDDGSETTATFKAAENTPFEITSPTEVFRLRVEVHVSNFGDLVTSASGKLKLSYSDDGGQNFLEIKPAEFDPSGSLTNTEAFIIASSSNGLVNGEPTTQQLTGFITYLGYPFIPGHALVDDEEISWEMGPEQKQEFEITGVRLKM